MGEGSAHCRQAKEKKFYLKIKILIQDKGYKDLKQATQQIFG